MFKIFKTTQNTVTLPTRELIKHKNTDFRVLAMISILSNVENNTLSGGNSRYCSSRKVDNNMDKMCKTVGITPSQLRKHLRTLLKHDSDEFRLVEKETNGGMNYCYEITYGSGGFVIIPYEKVEKLLISLSNNCIKLYANLLWLCISDGELVEKQIAQSTLLDLMGLSKSSSKVLKVATDALVKQGLIKTRREWIVQTEFVKGLPLSTNPREVIFYSIVTD